MCLLYVIKFNSVTKFRHSKSEAFVSVGEVFIQIRFFTSKKKFFTHFIDKKWMNGIGVK
jgi:hypothetical protein